MGVIELLFIAIGLSMDAFAVALCLGFSKGENKNYLCAALFGIFQAVMPILGWLTGKGFKNYIVNTDHWITFVILGFIGGKMIYSAFCDNKENYSNKSIFELILLALATSIDAFALGVTFAFHRINIIFSGLIIGIITFIISLFGIQLGGKFGKNAGSKAELAGGIILFVIGLKILFEHLGIINI